jgi:uncharacterized protein YdhG (YjbR/CyaY superfamily)
MDARKKSADTIDKYIAQFPGEIQEKLQQLRQTIREAAPQAEEAISFRMPAFRLNGTLVYFAAFRDHISFFPTSSAITAFRSEISRYKTSKGTVQFPLDEPIPLDLVRKMVRFRVEESLRKKETRKR